MKRFTATLIFIAMAASGTAFGQATATDPAAQPEMPIVFHAGGRHDKTMHEAALRAKTGGRPMAPAKVHAGGRHDVQAHKNALRSQNDITVGNSAIKPTN